MNCSFNSRPNFPVFPVDNTKCIMNEQFNRTYNFLTSHISPTFDTGIITPFTKEMIHSITNIINYKTHQEFINKTEKDTTFNKMKLFDVQEEIDECDPLFTEANS